MAIATTDFTGALTRLSQALDEQGAETAPLLSAAGELADAWHESCKDRLSLAVNHEEPTTDRGEAALQALADLNAISEQAGFGLFAEAADGTAALQVARHVSDALASLASENAEAGEVPPRKDTSAPKANAAQRGEEAAARYLEMFGYEILERNWKCPGGKVDIIARDGDAVVFVDVKTRTSLKKGLPSESVGDGRRARFEKIAGWYLRDYERVDVPIRFDTVALLVVAEDRALVRHYVNSLAAA